MLKSPKQPHPVARIVLISCLTALTLVGCGKSMEDLTQYVDDVKSLPPAPVPPLPEPKTHEPFPYQATDLRDPFDSSVLDSAVIEPKRIASSGISPDQNRTPEYLESYPLDTLRMVGTLEQEATLWALVKTPDSTIQRVTLGNHIGQNYGEIRGISQSKIELTEIVPDGFGGWRERDAFVALSEAGGK